MKPETKKQRDRRRACELKAIRAAIRAVQRAVDGGRVDTRRRPTPRLWKSR